VVSDGRTKNASVEKAGSRPLRAPKNVPGGSEFAPGVIVKSSEPAMPQRIVLFTPRISASRPAAQVERATTFPFTGDYRVYPVSSERKRHDWAMETGSLMENLYESVGGGSLRTVAEQGLHPPIDFSGCGKVMVLIHQEEKSPFTVMLELLTGDESVRVGSELGGGGDQRDEVFEFAIPAGVRTVKGLRLVFGRIPRLGSLSMKVAVQRFTLAPRGM
jgi:hypothetical protein